MGPIGPTELILILVIIVLLFGGSRLPQLGGALGKSIREFRTAVRNGEDDADKTADTK